jgi:hypothetical protein
MKRRSFILKSMAGAAAVTAAGGTYDAALAAPVQRKCPIVPLPSAARFRADVQRMVNFGPRLPGSAAHNAYVDWLEREFVRAGFTLRPAYEFQYTTWQPGRARLHVLDGPSAGPVTVSFPYVRSASTGREGITAPLSYVSEGHGGSPGSIFVIDLPAPAKRNAGVFGAIMSYLYWPGHSASDLDTVDYTRAWTGPWPTDFSSYLKAGAKAVVLIADNASHAALAGGFSPHQAPSSTPIPVLVVDRDAGARLRQQAGAGRRARLVLDAPGRKSTMRTITAVLPGQTDETIICNTHSDGQNAIEENGGPALLGLARHFASLPPGQRLKRTLVINVWSAHMTDPTVQPELDGWIRTHPDLFNRAVGGVTIEHLGCTLWVDDPAKGYHGTGLNEPYAIWTTEGPTFELAQPLLAKHDLGLHALLHGPIMFTVGNWFQQYGLPMVSGIAGPAYLLVISRTGEIEKLNFALASRQIAFYHDVIRGFDNADPAALRTGDPGLGQPVNGGLVPPPLTGTWVPR